MYIRRTLTRTLPTGAQYFSHRLVRSERVGGRVRQVTLLNLGTDFALGSTQWQALCSRIEDLLAGHADPVTTQDAPVLEVEAQRVAALLLSRQSRAAPRDEARTLESIDLGTLALTCARSAGLEQVGLWAIEELCLGLQLQALGMPQRHRAAAVALIVGRMAGVAWGTHGWLGERSALGELLGVDFQAFSPAVLRRAAEGLLTYRKALEAHLSARMHQLFGPLAAAPVYGLTNACLRGAPRAVGKARGDAPPVTLGLVVDPRGFIHGSAHFNTEVAAGKPLKRMLAGLDAPPGALVAIDRDAATASNLDWLRANGYHDLCRGETGWSPPRWGGAGEVLTELETVFGSLRPGLGVDEGDAEERDAAYLFITVLACQCVQLIRRRLTANGIDANWSTVRQVLAGQCRVTVSVRREDGRALHVRQATRADPEQLAIFQVLGIDPAPGGVQKTII